MLDVHVLTGSAPKAWLDQCLASIFEARGKAPFRVDVHVLAGEAGHIGRGRAAGYAMGTQPYVTFVDDDDYLLPDAFSAMNPAIDSGVTAICSTEILQFTANQVVGKSRHHLTAFRRDQIIDHTQWAACGDVAQSMCIKGDAIDLTEPTYVYRVYVDSPARLLRRAHPHELKAASCG
jgi:glycosyltransferase involved in cell wall biosynthesis